MDIFSSDYAADLDSKDPLANLRKEFHIPTKGDIKSSTSLEAADKEKCTYLCGNSLGLQPTKTALYAKEYLAAWATKGVYGHFTRTPHSSLPPWVDVDEAVTAEMGKIVGAQKEETAVMQTLTANLHFALCSFYRPSKERYKIIIEGKAFPSDHVSMLSYLLLVHLQNLAASRVHWIPVVIRSNLANHLFSMPSNLKSATITLTPRMPW